MTITLAARATLDTSYTDFLAAGPGDTWASASTQGVELWNGDTRVAAVGSPSIVTELRYAGDLLLVAPHVLRPGASAFEPATALRNAMSSGVSNIPSGARYGVRRASFSPDGSRAYVGVELRLSRRRGAAAPPSGTPTSRLLVTEADGALVEVMLDGADASGILGLAVSDEWLVLGRQSITARNRATGFEVAVGAIHGASALAMRFDASGERFAVATLEGEVTVWSVSSSEWKKLATWRHSAASDMLSGRATALAFHPGGEILATGGGDDTVRLWRLADTDAPVAEHALGNPKAMIKALSFSRDGQVLRVTDSSASSIYVLDVGGG